MKLYRSTKMVIAFIIAMSVSNYFNIDYPISAGIVALLNMTQTKKASAKIAWKRFYASVLGLMIMGVLFELFGYNYIVMSLFVAIFIPIATRMKAKEGIAINIVLSSHLVHLGDITIYNYFNELSLVIIGGLVAFLISMHVPNKAEKLEIQIQAIDESIKKILLDLSLSIRNLCYLDEDELNIEVLIDKIKKSKKMAIEYNDNYFSKDHSYYIEYLQMRLEQAYHLQYMGKRKNKLFLNLDEAIILSDFTERVHKKFDTSNDGKALMEELQKARTQFINKPLPTNILQLEEKAYLIQYLSDLEEFIWLKRRFAERFYD